MASDETTYDVVVIGGGPAGLSAALWAARYRRQVLLVDAGEHRNASVDSTHGYLGADGDAPAELIRRAIDDLARYPEVTIRTGASVVRAVASDDSFELAIDDGTAVRALRLVLCTGVRDLVPKIDGFDCHYGASVFTCPSCDGYEAQGRRVAVIGDSDHMAPFAVGLLDWASSVALVIEDESRVDAKQRERLCANGIEVVVGTPTALVGERHALEAIRLGDGRMLDVDLVFLTVEHEQRSVIARDLGCDISDEGSVQVDQDCLTTVNHVYAAGDITPGPHLVQVAAAKGATAGIAAALSLRGHRGASASSRPAPDPDAALA
ncbi:MAG: hypothetical protein JWN62_3174 [Acidimicrobiales bacterium]|nr:hypothetical protein [Acidimicrobiales bacterium]